MQTLWRGGVTWPSCWPHPTRHGRAGCWRSPSSGGHFTSARWRRRLHAGIERTAPRGTRKWCTGDTSLSSTHVLVSTSAVQRVNQKGFMLGKISFLYLSDQWQDHSQVLVLPIEAYSHPPTFSLTSLYLLHIGLLWIGKFRVTMTRLVIDQNWMSIFFFLQMTRQITLKW